MLTRKRTSRLTRVDLNGIITHQQISIRFERTVINKNFVNIFRLEVTSFDFKSMGTIWTQPNTDSYIILVSEAKWFRKPFDPFCNSF